MDKKAIEKDAKKVLDKFANALERVDSGKDRDDLVFVDLKDFERIEGKGEKCWEFKEDFLSNAPKHNEDFIMVEKGIWRK